MAVVPTSTDDVFINCPFDDAFAPTFRALIFAIIVCEFRPRSARELDDGGQTRIDKIYGLVEECRYGVHDLSRTELDAVHNLSRFNMPLELGLFLGAKRYGGKHQKAKRVLILDVEQYRYQRFISDLAGMDIHEHAGDPVRALREVRDWLANVSRRELTSADRCSTRMRRSWRTCRILRRRSSSIPSASRMSIPSGLWRDGWSKRQPPSERLNGPKLVSPPER